MGSKEARCARNKVQHYEYGSSGFSKKNSLDCTSKTSIYCKTNVCNEINPLKKNYLTPRIFQGRNLSSNTLNLNHEGR